ncbi:MAG: hypothetical protein R3F15_08890 [Lysobacterales bacterium]
MPSEASANAHQRNADFGSPVYGGAFNYLDVEAFKRFVLSRRWQMPESVLLLLSDEEDDGFSVFTPPHRTDTIDEGSP